MVTRAPEASRDVPWALILATRPVRHGDPCNARGSHSRNVAVGRGRARPRRRSGLVCDAPVCAAVRVGGRAGVRDPLSEDKEGRDRVGCDSNVARGRAGARHRPQAMLTRQVPSERVRIDHGHAGR